MIVDALDRKLASTGGLLMDPKTVRNWILFSLFFHLVAALFSLGYHQHDEHWQILEFANMKMGNVSAELLPWEYRFKMRSGLQPWMVYHLSGFLSLFGEVSPYFLTFILRFCSGVVAFGVSFWLLFSHLEELKTKLSQMTALVLTSLTWFLPYLHVRFASENWASIFFWSAFILLTRKQAIQSGIGALKKYGVVLAGLCLALAFLFRFNTGLMVAGLLLWTFFFEKNRKIESIAIGALCLIWIIGIGIPLDYWLYGDWTFSGWNFFNQNIVQGKLAGFGKEPWYFYFSSLLVHLIPPFSIVLLLLFFGYFVIYPRRAFTWAILPFFLVHLLLGHKELRFISPLVIAFPVVTAFSLQYFELKYKGGFQKIKDHVLTRFLVKAFLLLNIVSVLVASVKPANDKIYFFQGITEKYAKERSILLSYKMSVYVEMKGHLSFYRPRELREVQIDSEQKLIDQVSLHLKTGEKVLISYSGFSWPAELEVLRSQCTRTIRSIPAWLEPYNFSDWQARTRIWNIAECVESTADR